MNEGNFEHKPKTPEDTFDFSVANLKRVKKATERLNIAIDSLYENLKELEEMLESSNMPEEIQELESRILHHKQAITINEEKLRDFADTIAYWEKELNKAATEILEAFPINEDQPN